MLELVKRMTQHLNKDSKTKPDRGAQGREWWPEEIEHLVLPGLSGLDLLAFAEVQRGFFLQHPELFH